VLGKRLPFRENLGIGHLKLKIACHTIFLVGNPKWQLSLLGRPQQNIARWQNTHIHLITYFQGSAIDNVARQPKANTISPSAKLRRHDFPPGYTLAINRNCQCISGDQRGFSANVESVQQLSSAFPLAELKPIYF
jgi:hypothetical protein